MASFLTRLLGRLQRGRLPDRYTGAPSGEPPGKHAGALAVTGSAQYLLERAKLADEALARKRYGEAEAIYVSILRARPKHPRAQTNLALVQAATGRGREAEALLRDVIETHPDFADAYFNLAMVQHGNGDLDAAIEAYEKARAMLPASAEIRRNLASLRLMRGELTDPNWRDFAWRRLCEGFEATRFDCAAPLWTGEDLTGRSIVVHGEQGLGDEIMYASCFAPLIDKAGRVLVACNDRLTGLFARSFPGAEVMPISAANVHPERLTGVDFHVPAGDLMRHTWTAENLPRLGGAYLKADETVTRSWCERLNELGPGLKVGLSWRGGTERSNRDVRSLEMIDLAPLFEVPGIHWVNLQYDTHSAEIERLRTMHGCRLHHWPSAIEDYDQTAALVASLDLVISVATSVVHLAGALGTTVWVLVNAAPRWCYMHDSVRLPWYASAQVFRQSALGEWEPPASEVAMTLRKYALDAAAKSGAE